MLGTMIRRLRTERGLSLKSLALEADVPFDLLSAIEEERAERFEDNSVFLRVADRLNIRRAGVFARLLKANRPRRFRGYNVGLMKTGTKSIAGIFSKYRSAHEFLFIDCSGTVSDYLSGNLTEKQLRNFLRKRDILGALEMDSASWHFDYIEFLIDEFPDAKFLFTFRDCYSWLDSLVEFIFSSDKVEFSGVIRRRLGLPSDLARGDSETRKALRPELPNLIEGFLELWRNGNQKVLVSVPRDRLLIIRTHEISSSFDKIASFVGIPLHNLSHSQSFVNRTHSKRRLLHSVSHDYLDRVFGYYCGSLMNEHFPEFSLRGFLLGTSPGMNTGTTK